MKRFVLVTLTLSMAFVFLTARTMAAEGVVKERGFRGQGPSGQGFDKPLEKRVRVGATVPTFNQSAFVAITAGMNGRQR
jgi:hypothetical protein